MKPRTRILYHGRRPRPAAIRPLRRRDDVDHLCDLADRAGDIANGSAL